MRLFHQPTEAGNEYRYSVTLEAHNKPWLFALELPATLGSDMVATSDFQLFARRPVRERMRYDMRSRTGVGYFPERLDVIAEALSLPDTQNPRSVELGARWAADGGSDRERLRRAIDFMRDQGLTYSLQPPLMGEHVADEFLFDARRGFCEHFSSAFVVLMRAAGVPARVVTGYLGGEHNPVDDTWVIRQSDAHAWAEVWIEESGWVRVDPTAASAPARIDQNLAAAIPEGEPLPFLARAGLEWLREIRYRWWAANNLWNQWVLGYNPQRQREFLEKLGMAAPDWRKMGIALGVLGGGTLLALAIWLLWRRRPLDPAEKQWRRATRRLARRDLPRHPWEGPRDYARRVAAARPDLSRQIDAIAQLYARLRYGAAPAQLIDELRRRVAAFKP